MKIGIMTDIYNNLVALKTVVEYFKQQNCEKIVCCGDIIGIGPYHEESVAFLRALPERAECVVAEINRLDYPEAENIKKFFYAI